MKRTVNETFMQSGYLSATVQQMRFFIQTNDRGRVGVNDKSKTKYLYLINSETHFIQLVWRKSNSKIASSGDLESKFTLVLYIKNKHLSPLTLKNCSDSFRLFCVSSKMHTKLKEFEQGWDYWITKFSFKGLYNTCIGY